MERCTHVPDVTHYMNMLNAEHTARHTSTTDSTTESEKVIQPPFKPAAQVIAEQRRENANAYGYSNREATEADIKAGYSLDGAWKHWPNGVWGKRPAREIFINTHTVFKYPLWRRIEDTRNVYSAAGILLTEGKKYTFELAKYPETLQDQQDACEQLKEAVVEYGKVCPEPFTIRWIESGDAEVIEAQSVIRDLYEFYEDNKILDAANKKNRVMVWEFIKQFSDLSVALGVLDVYYKPATTLQDDKDVRYITKQIKKALK